jgi:hypothetical protein
VGRGHRQAHSALSVIRWALRNFRLISGIANTETSILLSTHKA